MKLLIVRHGESLGNVKNIIDDNSSPQTDKNGLSENGKVQAKKLVRKLESYKIDIVIVSPFKRTIETIQPYLEKHKIEVIISKLTCERNSGIFAGKPKGAIKEYCITNNITDRVSFKPKNGESLLKVYERAKKFLDYLKKNFGDKTVLLIGHVNFIVCLDIAIRKGNINEFYNYEQPGNGELRDYMLYGTGSLLHI